MYLRLDKNKMELELRVGIFEKYKPTKEVKKIATEVEALRIKMDEFMAKEVTPKLKELEDAIAKENSKFVV